MKLLWGAVILLHCVWGAYSQASCKRPCNSNTQPMTCVIYLVADVYYANQSDCFSCSRGVDSDCNRQYCIPADGRFRMVKAFNYSIPGPPIEVCEFDTVIVYVRNNFQTETTSVHWHGMHQIGTPDMDGVPMVTQRPILPNELYAYRFEAYPAGTHFYHSHSGSQRADGLFGKLIVRDYEPRVEEYDEDIHSMTLLEWFPMLTEDITMRYQRDGRFYDVEPEKTILVDRRGHTRTLGVPPTKYFVKQYLRYRFRLIHAGNIVCPMEVSIDDHTLLAFNSDGHDFKTVEVDSIVITNGERFDFVLHANKTVAQYTIRIIASSPICNVQAYAILEYEGASTKNIEYNRVPTLNRRLNCVFNRTSGCIYYPQLKHIYRRFDDRDLINYPYQVVPLYFDQYKIANERFKGTVAASELYTPFVNRIGFIPPPRTLLCNLPQETCNEYTAAPFTQCTHLIEIACDKVIEMVLIDEGKDLDLAHPFHLHGYSFMVMSQGQLGTNTTRDQVMYLYSKGQLARNSNPILKDTVAVPDGGYVVIRFEANNYGYWLMHCHVDFHTEEGMQLVIKTSCLPQIRNCTCFK